ncbi:hypothetical protein [Alsobacter sp. SYSU BS001988]|jgi:hypothetical protein
MRSLLIASFICLSAAACATRQQATGTAVGAVGGAVVGGPVGAVVGAGAGAVVAAPGGVVDQTKPRKKRVVRRHRTT